MINKTRFCGTGRNSPVGRALKDLHQRREQLVKGNTKRMDFWDYVMLNPEIVEDAYKKVRW